MTAPLVQNCRQCGACAPGDAHFCPRCETILPLGAQADYFAFLGLPRKLGLDSATLERRFRELSRRFHPDYFYNASPAERRASLQRSSYLNDAYRTLKAPVARLEYLLDLEDHSTKSIAGRSAQVPSSLLEEVFQLNEELDAIRSLRAEGAAGEALRARLERARAPIQAKRRRHEEELERLSAAWDSLLDRDAGASERAAVLSELRDRVLERNYINNLLAGIEEELTQIS